ncbi:MAG TPA: hypothetical protein VIJ86_02760 [Acidimicrobiales bacterium]
MTDREVLGPEVTEPATGDDTTLVSAPTPKAIASAQRQARSAARVRGLGPATTSTTLRARDLDIL